MYTCNTSQYNEKKGFASSISNENDHVYSKTHVGFVQILNWKNKNFTDGKDVQYVELKPKF